ncbi:MAG: hypothetical protein EPN56_12350 [Rhodanobacter sp.]|nr:MAG: hypothetical protein EPN56_12350 [Rhodanobacter sp.]
MQTTSINHRTLTVVPVGVQEIGVVGFHHNYHAVPGNLKRLAGFRSEVCRTWRHALLRRSQRHRQSWERFNRLARRPVLYCRQIHPYPGVHFAASRP